MNSSNNDLLDPLLHSGFKGYPRTQPPLLRSDIGAAQWNVLAGDLPLPLAVLKREALEHNLAWMQARVREWGVDLAPHGKTTMSPQLFQRQLDAGAWGMTFATVTQLAVGVAAGARRTLIANQVVSDEDLGGIQQLLRTHEGLRIVFLLDSVAQLDLIEAWSHAHQEHLPFELMIEIGVDGGRTGCRTHEQATTLAERCKASPAVKLVGIECYEGQGATGETGPDTAYTDTIMGRVEAVARHCETHGLFETDEVLVSAGGSAIYDLVAARLKPALGMPVRGLLRSGCYVTHDHGTYQRFQVSIDARLGCDCGDSLRPAMEVWTTVQSCPEPRLAIVAMGKRDVSFDLSMPTPIARALLGAQATSTVPASWHISALNDQHGYLRWTAADDALAPVVGERIGFGISHPCTTFDKWHWMPIVEDDYRVSDAVSINF
ncbi:MULTISPECIES: amino acid deaminase [unclassified Variovorax]|uniref:amino acid deaminase n=1 Tax=unclassified Variovorax TaxID=663243 RepID=UPI002B23C9BD|nr:MULTISPECIES: amino acid deaminase [unclassified Variovorax]MEB0058412.1 amino acid deaminase [Variovorax sp. LG9.2]MEB0111818.1 amino acid deaminase [Variovorax sp. RTB1]